MDKSYQNLIRTHVFEKTHTGVLANMPITDLEITLLTGRAHLKHTHGGDFREAVYRAIRQGLCKAESVLLEPLYRFSSPSPAGIWGGCWPMCKKCAARLKRRKQGRHGDGAGARCPCRRRWIYAKELLAFTKGSGAHQHGLWRLCGMP